MNGSCTGSGRRSGVVVAVTPTEVTVKIQQLSACTGCHAKEFCTTADSQDRLLKIPTQGRHYELGQAVLVEARDSIGRRAILLAFLLPLLLLLLGLGLGLHTLGLSEGLSIALSLVLLVLYGLLLYASRGRLARSLRLELHPLTSTTHP